MIKLIVIDYELLLVVKGFCVYLYVFGLVWFCMVFGILNRLEIIC